VKLSKFLQAVPLLIGTAACGTLERLREEPRPVEVVQAVVIPAECRVDPVEPMAVDPPVLPSLPAPVDPAYLAVRTQRAELAGLHFQAERDEERLARVTNAGAQTVCATWARTQP
jgi:hypothetical protein